MDTLQLIALVGSIVAILSAVWVILVGQQGLLSLARPRIQKRIPKILLPPPANFVNRDTEVAELVKFIKPQRWPGLQKYRKPGVILIWGMPGIGKTELALKIAYEMDRYFKDGIVWIHVGASSAEEVLAGLSKAFEIDTNSLNSPLQRRIEIQKGLQGKNALIVLDNAERTEPIVDVYNVIYECNIIITSRNRLFIPHACEIKLKELPIESAVSLFEKSSQTNVGEPDKLIVLQICDRVGKLPLAVVLASKLAGLAGLLPLKNLIEDAALDILRMRGSSFNQSVRTAFESTYQYLNSDEQKLFAMLGVFSEEGFGIQAARYICGLNNFEANLGSLVNLSFVQQINQERYYLHPLLKRYALEKIEDHKEIYSRMAQYYLEFLNDPETVLKMVESERANIILAMNWARSNEQWLFARELAVGLLKYVTSHSIEAYQTLAQERKLFSDLNQEEITLLVNFDFAWRTGNWQAMISLMEVLLGSDAYNSLMAKHGYWNELVTRSLQALDASIKLGDKNSEARFNSDIGLFYYWQGMNQDAYVFFRRALEQFEQLGNIQGEILTLQRLGYIEDDRNDYKTAYELYDRSLELASQLNDPGLISVAKHLVGVVLYHQKEFDVARNLLEESLQDAIARQDISLIARTQRRLSAVARMQGHYAPRDRKHYYYSQARELIKDCLAIEKNLRSRARALRQLGMVSQEENLTGESLRQYQESLEIFEKLGNKKGISAVKFNLGSLHRQMGLLVPAVDYLNESLAMTRELSCVFGEAFILRELAWIAQMSNKFSEASVCFDKAIELLDLIGSPYGDEFREQALHTR